MKINRLEAHDRLKYLVQDQSANVFQGAEDCLKKNPLSLTIQEKCPYVYIFAHPRTADDGVTKVLYWQPRLSIPEPQTNSYLFRAISHTDNIQIVWMIPPREHWEQYKQGNVTEQNICLWSINMFQYGNTRKQLSEPNPEDIPEQMAKNIMRAILIDHENNIRKNKIKPTIEEPSSI